MCVCMHAVYFGGRRHVWAVQAQLLVGLLMRVAPYKLIGATLSHTHIYICIYNMSFRIMVKLLVMQVCSTDLGLACPQLLLAPHGLSAQKGWWLTPRLLIRVLLRPRLSRWSPRPRQAHCLLWLALSGTSWNTVPVMNARRHFMYVWLHLYIYIERDMLVCMYRNACMHVWMHFLSPGKCGGEAGSSGGIGKVWYAGWWHAEEEVHCLVYHFVFLFFIIMVLSLLCDPPMG